MSPDEWLWALAPLSSHFSLAFPPLLTKPMSAATEPTVETKADVEVKMDENEDEKKLRAVRQGPFSKQPPSNLIELTLATLVEFYFADSNLPFDKYVSRTVPA